MIILGAGMAGCLAAIMNPNSRVLEASAKRPTNHKAVLRFRSNEISKITGIPFEKVTVRKGIYFNGKFMEPNIQLCNMYSQKVIGSVSNRSIWNLNTVERYIAPPNFHDMLLWMIYDRVEYNVKVTGINDSKIYAGDFYCSRKGDPVISTIPMHILEKITGLEKPLSGETFTFQKIFTKRGKVPGSNVHQTIYYPSHDTAIYRATLTGEDLIIESAGQEVSEISDSMVCKSFGITYDDVNWERDSSAQKYGKIAPINDSARRNFIFGMTQNLNIYSLGRFGIWKNILLDDVIDDISIIKKLTSADKYELMRKKV